MWFFATKKKVQESFDKFKDNLTTLTNQSLNNKTLSEKNKETIETNKEKIARLEGMLIVLMQKSPKSQSHQVSVNPPKSQGNIETKMINRIRRSKKALVVAEINKLSPSMSVIEMYEEIVLNKGICSKASFYRYIASLKYQQSQLIQETEIKERQ